MKNEKHFILKGKRLESRNKALETQKEGECAVWDVDKKKYVNVKTFPKYNDPFTMIPITISLGDLLFREEIK